MAAKAASVRDSVLNFNVGVLGHIDSGKTALGERLMGSCVICARLNTSTCRLSDITLQCAVSLL